MFSKLMTVYKYIKLKKINSETCNKSNYSCESIPKSIAEVKKKLVEDFKNCSDVIYKEVILGSEKRRGLVCYIALLADRKVIDNELVNSIMSNEIILPNKRAIEYVMNSIITECEVEKLSSYEDAIEKILSGNGVLFIEGEKSALSINAQYNFGRSVEEPDNETVVRGPKEGFIESIDVNIALIRKKIKDINLKVEKIKLGQKTKTEVAICYLNGTVKKEIVEEVKKRVNKIKIDAILESGYIEQFIEDKPYSTFSTVGNTEKPDVVSAKILEGRVAILCDGSPHVLTVPHLFVENIQISEDYYGNTIISSYLRMIRVISVFISILLPGIYVALQTFHQEMIPTVLLISMTSAREGVPFPAAIEALLMNFFFELLRESGVRLPRAIGPAISIVGALILGEAGVNAGLISAPMVMVIALTGLAAFITPSLTGPITTNRVIFIILGGTLGIYGISAGVYIMLTNMLSIKSFGVPYMYSFSPFINFKDSILRFPMFKMKKSSEHLDKYNLTAEKEEETKKNE
ncbi:spore germination protein [Clostridium sp. MSJ-11]|uniref:Spore germination protein n=1 Tax=Clostridium mobile TaxID=2841512 RepID=A0ABS6EJT5_9CLOT|nr:spore germination protein [Clostridium mobile]MBU5485308.1 spore germination protein [Clostridium mobile]